MPIRFRLSVYPTCVLKSMGYTRSRNHFASTMHDDVNLRHQDPHSVSPMHGVMVHKESTPSFVVVTMAIPTLTPIAPQCGDVSGCSIHNSSISSSSSSNSSSRVNHHGFDFWCTPNCVQAPWGTLKVETKSGQHIFIHAE